jgi:nitroalkane oxidase
LVTVSRHALQASRSGLVAAGFLRKCIPAPAGGDNAGLIDMAIMAEEFYSVNASITLTMLGVALNARSLRFCIALRWD